ncbi:phage tail length tape measure family protein, partial [Escherichia coli]|uniref:phage tail length tape measure family protein n=4 Tax=Enterobacteriaceae TaxID=543 RepID=UPI0011E45D33
RIVAKASQQWSQVMEDDASRIETAFSSIATSPVRALAELNKEYNFLSVSQLRHIDELERTKGKQAAVTEGMKLFADTMGERMQQIDDASTPLEQMWD